MLRLFHALTRHRCVRFLVAGGTSATITVGTVFVLTTFYHVWYVMATAAGFIFAVCVNFALQKWWTFRERDIAKVHTQSVHFFVVNGINFFLNGLLVVFFVEHVGLWPVAAQVCSAVVLAVESFIAYTYIFRPRGDASVTVDVPYA